MIRTISPSGLRGQAPSSLVERIIAARIASRTLAALRDALLPKLISGELRVKDAEGFVDRVNRANDKGGVKDG